MLQARKLSVRLGDRQIVRNIDCSLGLNEVVGLIGPNGSGKSTLLRALAGVLQAESGAVLLNGMDLRRQRLREVARVMAYLPQGAECHWPLTSDRVVALGRLPFGDGASPEGEKHIRRALEAVDAWHLRDRVISELSGGERARVLLARALAGDPALLLIDEPADGLDPFHQLQLMELLIERAREGRGVLVVLHELGMAARFCHRLLLLKDGMLLASGTPAEVLTDKLLAEVHGVSAFRGRHRDQPVLVPWERSMEPPVSNL